MLVGVKIGREIEESPRRAAARSNVLKQRAALGKVTTAPTEAETARQKLGQRFKHLWLCRELEQQPPSEDIVKSSENRRRW